MEFPSLILPFTKNICRICLSESDESMSIQDLIEYELNQVKLIDILIFLNCLESNNEENWPQEMCASCIAAALIAYNFKLNCLKANTILSQTFTTQNSTTNVEDSIDNIDINIINVVYQDHEYLSFSPNNSYNIPENKELTPLPPVTEITSAEKIPPKEGDKKYACTLCTKLFTRINGLHYHMAKHSNFYRFLCSKCGKKFHTSNGLSQHLISHKEVAQFKCGFCNKNYKSRQSLKDHFRIAHSSNSKSFVCITCDKKFTAKSTLMMHIKTHNGEKKYACPDCPKKYTRASYLKAHSLIHTEQGRPRPFLCNHVNCGRRFSSKYCLFVHVAHTHKSDRPHKCNVCSKGFATSMGLKVHTETHNTKELNCDICGVKVGNKRMLQKHKKSHGESTNDIILETIVDDVFFDQLY